MNRNHIKIFAIDIDNTLTKETCWTEEQCLNATPQKETIDYINNLLKQNHFVYLYTCRNDNLMNATHEWVRKQGLNLPICNTKSPADYYLDDKSL